MLEQGHTVTLGAQMVLHWKHNASSDSLELAFQYIGQGWLGIGFAASSEGKMVNSRAVVGVSGATPSVQLYQLVSQNTNDISQVMRLDNETAIKYNLQGHLDVRRYEGVLRFSVGQFTDFAPPVVREADGMGDLWTLLYATGESMTLGSHEHRGALQVPLTSCVDATAEGRNDWRASTSAPGQPQSSLAQVPYDHQAAFVAHGILATLAFAIVMPLAVGTAWFRALIPKWWIYVHVLSNGLAVCVAVLAVVVAFGGMELRHQQASSLSAKHMSSVHHWTGLVLLVAVSWQVLNGLRRPPVEPRLERARTVTFDDEDSVEELDGCYGECVAQCGDSPRERWHFVHRCTALGVGILTIFQLTSGASLFSLEYKPDGHETAVIVLWIWMAGLVLLFGGLKLYLRRKEQQAVKDQRHPSWRRAPPRNLMPQRDDDGSGHHFYHGNGIEGDEDSSVDGDDFEGDPLRQPREYRNVI